MPAYNFKARFAPLVESGEKRQTIRKPRKRPTVAGDRLKLYTGMRTKACRLFFFGTCQSVEPVVIDIRETVQLFPAPYVEVAGKLLPYSDMLALAEADGFSSVWEMVEFFKSTYGLPAALELIKW